MPTVKFLALRRVDFCASFLSFFPGLQEMHLMRLDITECNDANLFPPPSFELNTLVLERCSEYGNHDYINRSISALKDYYDRKAEEQGIRPFEHVQTLGMTFERDPDLPMLSSMLKVPPHLQRICLVSPHRYLAMRDLIHHFRDNNIPLSLQFIHFHKTHPPDFAVVSQSFLMRHIASHTPSFSFDSTLFECAPFKGPTERPIDLDFESWRKCVGRLSNTDPDLVAIGLVEIYLVDTMTSGINGEDDLDKVAKEVVSMRILPVGTCFEPSVTDGSIIIKHVLLSHQC
ncbi:hypothetical protein CVT24_011464 [Panaeolus cyanescens]|uniref:Uncharacterized protein n=1 Tax=Panaeolus cyanescens TaxID=181874 RepID=A0A409YGU6_9AGAR|nr:hypothetical protein CVT24_011464 [Panaeolus cyanescens]